MKSRVLVGFGDSWANGDELPHPKDKKYMNLLANHFGWPVLNYAVSSSSIGHMVWQFQQFVETHWHPDNQYHAVFFLTGWERVMYFDHRDYSVICHGHPSHNPLTEQEDAFYKFYNEPFGIYSANKDILALQSLCKIYGVVDYWIPGWEQIPLWSTVNTARFFSQNQRTITQLFTADGARESLHDIVNPVYRNAFIWPNSGHPNELGHRTIADAMIPIIQQHVH